MGAKSSKRPLTPPTATHGQDSRAPANQQHRGTFTRVIPKDLAALQLIQADLRRHQLKQGIAPPPLSPSASDITSAAPSRTTNNPPLTNNANLRHHQHHQRRRHHHQHHPTESTIEASRVDDEPPPTSRPTSTRKETNFHCPNCLIELSHIRLCQCVGTTTSTNTTTTSSCQEYLVAATGSTASTNLISTSHSASSDSSATSTSNSTSGTPTTCTDPSSQSQSQSQLQSQSQSSSSSSSASSASSSSQSSPSTSSPDAIGSRLNRHTTTNKMSCSSKQDSHQPISPHEQKGLAYTREERKKLGLLGLIPPAYQSQDLQVEVVMNFIETIGDQLNKYIYLRHLKDYNERLFYKTVTQNVEKLMPIVYTPVVGLACQKFSHIYMRPRGLYITIEDLGQVSDILANWPEKDVRAIVMTDGERILGLGDLGANGMGISIGKLSLYTALAGIPPKNVLPITIDVGTNNNELLKDPYYTGLRQQRVRGAKYDQLLEEVMESVVEHWGRSCLIQFEDFANSTAFDLLQRYRARYCTFNDDIQGTASVCLSGLFSAAKITNTRMGDHTYLFYGAGEANLGTAQLLVMAMIEYGVKEADAKKKIWLVDSRGLVVRGRDGPPLSGHKAHFLQEGPPIKDLEGIIDFVKPTALIGASAQGASFTEAICAKMAALNERPIIFALSNPTSKAECTAEQAYKWTDGRCVFASGSPFDPVQHNGKTYITGQGNNAYIFPGVGLAVIAARVHSIPEETFLVAAKALSDQLTDSDIEVGLVYPRLSKIREVTLKVAARVFHYFYAERLANHRPEPQDKLSYLRNIQYDYDYTTTASLAKMTLDGAAKTHQDSQVNKNGSSLFTATK